MSKIKNVPTQMSNEQGFIKDSGTRESTVVTKAPIDLFKTVLIFVFLLLVASFSVNQVPQLRLKYPVLVFWPYAISA